MKLITKILKFQVKQKPEETDEHLYARATKQMLKMNAVDFGEYIPTFQLKRNKTNGDIAIEMFLTFDSKEIDKRLCDICQEIAGSFYLPGSANCRDCKYQSFLKRIKEKTDNVKYYGKVQIERKKKWGS